MTTVINSTDEESLTTGQWAMLGLAAVVGSVAAVLIVRALALAIWPDVALFEPLAFTGRAALFTAVPALVATVLLAWLTRRRANPVGSFVRIALVVLLLSFIPDYILPDPNRTFLASTIAAFLHLVAAVVIVAVLVSGYRRMSAD